MKTLAFKYRVWRSRYWRLKRLIYMSPAEVRFIELMGGKVVYINWLKSKSTGFRFTIVITLGKYLKQENMKREVRYGKYFVDFSNDLHRIIEVDGSQWHMDVVADMDREIAIKALQQEARFLRIKAYQIYNNSAEVQRKVLKFLD